MKRRRMMIWPWKMPDSTVHLVIGVARALGAELPDSPVDAMFLVQVAHQRTQWVPIRSLWVG